MDLGQQNAAFRKDSFDENHVQVEVPNKAINCEEQSNDCDRATDTIHKVEPSLPNDANNNSKDSIYKRGRSFVYKRRGLFLATGAAFFFSAENIFMELTTLHLNIFQTGATMGAIVLLLTFLVAVITKQQIPNTKLQYFSLLMSGLFLAVGLPLALESLKHMEVGDSITIIYTMPIFAGIFSWIILKEPLRVIDFFFGLLSFAGVILVARPPFIFRGTDDSADGENPLLGALYALASAVSFALLVVAARKQSFLGLHPIIILLFNSIVVLVSNAIVCTILHQWQMPAGEAWGYVLGLGFCDFFAQTLIYMAVVVEVAMYVSIISTSEVIMTFVWQFAIFSIAPHWMSAIGAVLIIAACVGMATKTETSPDEIAVLPEDSNKCDATVPTISEGIVNDAASLAD
ncbi:solute carrier family 35 member G1-like isoform X2 [Apostichopus japonicus]